MFGDRRRCCWRKQHRLLRSRMSLLSFQAHRHSCLCCKLVLLRTACRRWRRERCWCFHKCWCSSCCSKFLRQGTLFRFQNRKGPLQECCKGLHSKHRCRWHKLRRWLLRCMCPLPFQTRRHSHLCCRHSPLHTKCRLLRRGQRWGFHNCFGSKALRRCTKCRLPCREQCWALHSCSGSKHFRRCTAFRHLHMEHPLEFCMSLRGKCRCRCCKAWRCSLPHIRRVWLLARKHWCWCCKLRLRCRSTLCRTQFGWLHMQQGLLVDSYRRCTLPLRCCSMRCRMQSAGLGRWAPRAEFCRHRKQLSRLGGHMCISTPIPYKCLHGYTRFGSFFRSFPFRLLLGFLIF